MRIFKIINYTVLSVLTILLLSSCVVKDDVDSISDENFGVEKPTETGSTEDSENNQGIESLMPVLTLNQALELFYNTFENDTINFRSIKFKKDTGGNYRYFIKGWDDNYNFELEVDVGTAEIIKQEKERADGVGERLDLEAAITPKEAMDAALAGLDLKSVEDWELKVDQNNRMIYEIGFLDGVDQKVDALTGKVQ